MAAGRIISNNQVNSFGGQNAAFFTAQSQTTQNATGSPINFGQNHQTNVNFGMGQSQNTNGGSGMNSGQSSSGQSGILPLHIRAGRLYQMCSIIDANEVSNLRYIGT